MTPELKTACELVFQEHKISSQIKWDKDAFRGRIPVGLSEMAKQTLVRKNIIFLPNKSKKIITLLNPAVVTATSFEEAEEMIENKIQAPVASLPDDHPAYIARPVSGSVVSHAAHSHRLLSIAGVRSKAKDPTPLAGVKWYMKPLVFYVVWPFCAAVAGAVIPWLMDMAYSKLFLDWK
ncbi:MAG: hypothetical protein Q8941_23775 [Bacteroidota bacterium]|nr:hypothetical protein [Bacteroidota bacterium]